MCDASSSGVVLLSLWQFGQIADNLKGGLASQFQRRDVVVIEPRCAFPACWSGTLEAGVWHLGPQRVHHADATLVVEDEIPERLGHLSLWFAHRLEPQRSHLGNAPRECAAILAYA